MVNNKFPPCVQNSRFFAIGWAERGGYILLSLCLLIQVYCLARWIETVWLQTQAFLNPWAYAWIGFAVVRYTCKPLVEYLSQRRALFLVQSVQSHLLHQYFYESPYQSRSMDAAAWTTLVQDQIPLLHNYFAQYQPTAWLLRVTPILYVAVIIGHDWFLGLLFVCTIPLLPFFMMIIGWGAQSVQKKHAQMLQKLSSLFADRLRVLSMLQRFGAVSQQAQVLVDRHTEWKQLTLKVLKIAFLSSAVLELFAALSVALVAMTIGFRWLGTFPLPLPELKFYIGFFILFLAPEVYAPFRQYAALYHEKDQALAVLATIPSSAYAAPIQVEYPPKNVLSHSGYESPAAPENNYLHFQALRPQYTHINVDAVFKARDKVYITGKNGVGKTALLEACLGILPYTGDILLQGTSMKACPQNASSSFFYLPATPRILPLSLAENIALAYPAASPAEILEAARQACIDPKFLTESSLAARCDEQLIPQLSAGQLQRFALARLWLSRAPILLLDEPFSYQDASTKVLLMERLLAFAHDRLLILVSHEPIVHSAFTHILNLSEPEHTL